MQSLGMSELEHRGDYQMRLRKSFAEMGVVLLAGK